MAGLTDLIIRLAVVSVYPVVIFVCLFGPCIVPGIILMCKAKECMDSADCSNDNARGDYNNGLILLLVSAIPVIVYIIVTCVIQIREISDILGKRHQLERQASGE